MPAQQTSAGKGVFIMDHVMGYTLGAKLESEKTEHSKVRNAVENTHTHNTAVERGPEYIPSR